MHIPQKPALLRRFGHKYAYFPICNIQFVRGTKGTVLSVPFSRRTFWVSVSETTQNYQFGETTPPGYYEPLQTLNVELVLIAPYGVERSSNMRRS